MAISVRTLNKWRRDALIMFYKPSAGIIDGIIKQLSKRILAMTQELLDQRLIEKESKDEITN